MQVLFLLQVVQQVFGLEAARMLRPAFLLVRMPQTKDVTAALNSQGIKADVVTS